MMREELLEVIVGELNLKYRCVADTYSYTKRLNECLAVDDRNGAKDALISRAAVLEKAGDCDKRIEKLLYSEKYADIREFLGLLKGETNKLSADTQLTEVVEIIERMRVVWGRTVEIDKDLSKRIIGKDSYYK